MSIQEIIQSNLKIKEFEKKTPVELNLNHVTIACDVIESLGERATQAKVRSALGGGSFTTLGPLLKEWRQSIADNHELSDIEIPVAIQERSGQLLGLVWQSALDEAESRLNLQREELKKAQEEARQEIQDFCIAIETLESEAQAYQDNLNQKQALIVSLETENDSNHEKIIALELEKKELSIRLSHEKDDKQRLESESSETKSELKTAQAEIKQRDEHIKQLELSLSHKHQIETELKRTVELNRSLTDAKNNLHVKNETLEKKVLDLKQRLETVRSEKELMMQKSKTEVSIVTEKLETSQEELKQALKEHLENEKKWNSDLLDQVKKADFLQKQFEVSEREKQAVKYEYEKLKEHVSKMSNKTQSDTRINPH